MLFFSLSPSEGFQHSPAKGCPENKKEGGGGLPACLRPRSSNPGLFALLTLLVIPVFIFVGLLIYACLPRAPVCEPVPVCPPAPMCPAPAPVVYYAEPCAMPCAAATPPMGCF